MTTNGPTPDQDQRPDSPARRIDAACDRFEADWRAGQGPRIEEVVAAAAEPERPALLRELIALEAELRRARGERPTPGEYHDRFLGQVGLVDAVFAETALVPGSRRPGPHQDRMDTGLYTFFSAC